MLLVRIMEKIKLMLILVQVRLGKGLGYCLAWLEPSTKARNRKINPVFIFNYPRSSILPESEPDLNSNVPELFSISFHIESKTIYLKCAVTHLYNIYASKLSVAYIYCQSVF